MATPIVTPAPTAAPTPALSTAPTGTNGQGQSEAQANSVPNNYNIGASAPTVADLYGGVGSLNDQAEAADAAKVAAYDPNTEAQTRQDVIDSFQSQIDGLDQAAAGARARITSELAPAAAARTGAAGALAAARGLAGSNIGSASIDAANQQNASDLNDKISASDATYQTQKDTLNQFIQGEADKEVSLRQTAAANGADAKIQEIKDRTSRATDSATASVTAMLAAGITDPTNPNYASTISKISSTTGLTPDQVTALYTNTKAAQTTASANAAKTAADTTLATAQAAQIPATAAQAAQDEQDKNAQFQQSQQLEYAKLAETKAENTLAPDEISTIAGQLNTYNGKSYVTSTDLEGLTAKQKSVAIQALGALGAKTLSPKDADAINSISAAKSNLQSFSDFLSGGAGGTPVLPKNWLGQPIQAADVKLNDYLTMNPQLGSFSAWQAQIIPLLSALKGAGSGGGGSSRLFGTIGTLLPTADDTVAQAQQKITAINTILDNGAGSILGTQSSSSSDSSSTSTATSSAPAPITAPDGTQVIITD